jgi:hypothetical protein
MVFTKVKYLFCLSVARTSVMPFNVADFTRTPGFQIRYNTTDARVLADWHDTLCQMVHDGFFEFLCESTKVSYFSYPKGKEYLERHVREYV